MHEDINPADTQVGGGHYKKYAIQPSEFIHRNGIGFLEGNVLKYTIRHRDKNGAEDIRKAIHYLQLLLEWEYGERFTNEAPVKTGLSPLMQVMLERQEEEET
jgi:hypothetical protein